MHGASGFVVMLPQMEGSDLYSLADFENGGIWNDKYAATSSQGDWWTIPSRVELVTARPGGMVCPSDASEPTYADTLQYTVVGPSSFNAATGSYALCQGSLGPSHDSNDAKYWNNGLFTFAVGKKRREITDGTSKTFASGEISNADDRARDPSDSSLHCSIGFWSWAWKYTSAMRSTENPLNTLPCFGVTRNEYQYNNNGAFGSDHPGGGNFVFVDGHVVFVSDNVDHEIYKATSTIAGPGKAGGTEPEGSL